MPNQFTCRKCEALAGHPKVSSEEPVRNEDCHFSVRLGSCDADWVRSVRFSPLPCSHARMSWPSLEIGRGDVEALDWWFYEIESRLSHAAPDARPAGRGAFRALSRANAFAEVFVSLASASSKLS